GNKVTDRRGCLKLAVIAATRSLPHLDGIHKALLIPFDFFQDRQSLAPSLAVSAQCFYWHSFDKECNAVAW
ncbi:hypothetical protein N5C39_25200, partial [Enterobacter bugandensis]